ncbi:MAG: DEAD/DEAH box helicase, partial [Bradymonadaceae bacterium]
DESEVRELLRHTWHPFFGRFGRLREVQLAAVRPIAGGRNVLVGAPTASGKTEAVVAPLTERVFFGRAPEASTGEGPNRRRFPSFGMLVISPTRALCRDLGRRLTRPAEQCGLEVDVKTGDATGVDFHGDPPEILVTTPESLDSALARHPRALRDTRAVVLDELHLLDGTARGDQLQCLLERLRRIVREDLQICGASATLPQGEDLARSYLGPEGHFLQREDDDGRAHRAIEAELIEASHLEQAADVVEESFQRGDDRKLLVFANTRAQVEDLTAILSERELLRDRVYAHHGSLSRAERLQAEERLRDAPSAICVATMTLEVGIDIGDVDRTILAGPPPDVSSLLQRIGRGNRGEDATRVTCLYRGEFERQRTSHLLESASLGRLFTEDVPFRPSLLAQQALSLVFQSPSGWISAQALHSRLSREARRAWTRADCRAVLEQLADDGYLHDIQGDRYAPDAEAEHDFEYGRVHSNIEDVDEVEVVDELTRQTLGRVRFRPSHADKLREGEDLAVALGGKRRKAVRYVDDQLVVRSEDGLEDAQFIATQPPRYSRELAADLAQYLGLDPTTLAVEPLDDGWLLFHFLGTLWGRLFEYMLRRQNLVQRRGSKGAFFFEVRDPPDEAGFDFESREALVEATDATIRGQLGKFVKLLGPGPFDRWVPRDRREEWVRRTLEPERFVETLLDASIEHESVTS